MFLGRGKIHFSLGSYLIKWLCKHLSATIKSKSNYENSCNLISHEKWGYKIESVWCK